MVAPQLLRRVDMNRLALACVTVVRLVDVEFDDVVGMSFDLTDGAALYVDFEHDSFVDAVADGDDENVVARLGNDKLFLMNIFELFDHL